jgi:agmatine deiminase
MTAPDAPNYRWPAEWEPLEAVWVVPPHNPETWPGCLEEAQAEHAAWRKAMSEVVWVRSTKKAWIDTDDSWVRDFGPLFVFDENGGLVVQDFRFDSWGGKYEARPNDDEVARAIGETLGLPVVRHDRVLEGGALETDGRGTLLTTTDCLLEPSRNGPTDRAAMEQLLRDTLGITRTVWLTLPAGGLPGDDTDGHIDNAARFIDPDTVVVHPALDAAPLHDAGLNVLTLPGVEPIFYDYPADSTGPARHQQLPASYANFVIANGRVFVPTFGQPSDDVALKLLDDAMSEHQAVPIRSNHLLVGQGGLHCLSMQQPAEMSI